jgi:hypothetical protein
VLQESEYNCQAIKLDIVHFTSQTVYAACFFRAGVFPGIVAWALKLNEAGNSFQLIMLARSKLDQARRHVFSVQTVIHLGPPVPLA